MGLHCSLCWAGKHGLKLMTIKKKDIATLVLFDLHGPIRSTLILFHLFWPYSVHFSSIWSILFILDLFGLLWSYLVYFGLICFNSLYFDLVRSFSIHFGSIWSTLVLFNPHRSYSIYLVLFVPCWSYTAQLVLFSPFSPLWSHSVHFGFIWSTSIIRFY